MAVLVIAKYGDPSRDQGPVHILGVGYNRREAEEIIEAETRKGRVAEEWHLVETDEVYVRVEVKDL